jgi:DNA-binding beta-propeller fold protein YncE
VKLNDAISHRKRHLGYLLAVLGVSAGLLALWTSSASAAPSVVDTISFPGGEPLDVAVYETGNKIFVTEDNGGDLYIIDGTTHQILNIVDVGGAAFDIAVNETYGRVYVASDKACCTTGITPGTGLISVIDADTNQFISQFDPGPQGNVSFFALESDEVHDKVYVGFYSGVGVIDASNDQFSLIPGAPVAPDQIEVNTVTNKVYLIRFNLNSLKVIDGVTHALESVPWPAGSSQPLDLAVSEVENKVYVTMLTVPVHAGIAILILDRDTGSSQFVGADDLEPLAFNQSSNRLFAGVQVGQKGAIVEGANDALTQVDLGAAGMGSIDVRSSTDNAYLASSQFTVAVNGLYKCSVKFTTAPDLGGGLVVSAVAVNQGTGRVYVNNRHQAGKVTVLQDSGPGCIVAYPRPIAATPVRVPLVQAYQQCTSPNRTHGPPLDDPACSPPVQESSFLTVGTFDANGQNPNSTGSARLRVLVGDPATPADEADVQLKLSLTDVRKKSDLSDYTGELQATSTIRITDKLNGATFTEAATVQDIGFPVTVPCTATSTTTIGATCSVTTTFDAVMPGSITERKRAIWQVNRVRVLDGGADGVASSSPNTLFATQGVFVP